MSVAPPETKTDESSEPDELRMTIGEHLEELRSRLIRGLLGFVVAMVACLIYGERIMGFFCAPFYNTLAAKGLKPEMVYTEVSEPFMVYMRVSLICALAVALPWMAYQLWQFVAAGLYPNERKTITRYIPLSLALLIAGMVFVYFLVLPWSIQFFVDFGNSIPSHLGAPGGAASRPVAPTLAPMITLSAYIDMVTMMLISFGLAFQLPLVVMAVVRVGIVDVAWLKKGRRYVYFALAIFAAALSPGDMVTAMIAMMVPLILLYEFGIGLSQWGKKREVASQ